MTLIVRVLILADADVDRVQEASVPNAETPTFDETSPAMEPATRQDRAEKGSADQKAAPGGPQIPSLVLPKGGGAIRGIGEKFAANAVTGTGSPMTGETP